MKDYAPIRKRIAAGIIDYILVYGFTFLYMYAFGELNEEEGYHVEGWKVLPIIFFWFLMMVGMEQWKGSTVGNSLMKIRAVPLSNYKQKLSWSQSIKRQLLTFVDFNLSIVTYILIKNTEHKQRLGDIWAKTVVIKN
jgi:uncharacterized RDD family membrane protein YckC